VDADGDGQSRDTTKGGKHAFDYLTSFDRKRQLRRVVVIRDRAGDVVAQRLAV
jgi:hypothetical protein